MRRNLSKKPFVNLGLLALASAVVLAATGCSTLRPARTAPAPWQTYLYDAARTNRSPEKTVMPPSIGWKAVLGPAGIAGIYKRVENSTPAVSDGLVYAGSVNGKFYAMNRDEGWIAWMHDAGSAVESTATVAGRLVCFGSSGGVLRCLDKITGVEQWSFQAKSEIISSPLVKDGTLYFYSSDDRLYALDLDSGKKIWGYTRGTFRTVTLRNTGSPAAAAVKGGDRVVQLFTDGFLVCLEASTGRVAWETKVIDDPSSSGVFRKTPMVAGGKVYFIDDSGYVTAFDLRDGSRAASYSVLKAVDFLFIDKKTLVIAGEESILAFDLFRNVTLWKTDVKFAPVSGIFSSGSHIFIASNHEKTPFGLGFLSRTRGYIQAVSISNGRVEWSRKLGSTISSGGVIAERSVPILLDAGRLELFTFRDQTYR